MISHENEIKLVPGTILIYDPQSVQGVQYTLDVWKTIYMYEYIDVTNLNLRPSTVCVDVQEKLTSFTMISVLPNPKKYPYSFTHRLNRSDLSIKYVLLNNADGKMYVENFNTIKRNFIPRFMHT